MVFVRSFVVFVACLAEWGAGNPDRRCPSLSLASGAGARQACSMPNERVFRRPTAPHQVTGGGTAAEAERAAAEHAEEKRSARPTPSRHCGEVSFGGSSTSKYTRRLVGEYGGSDEYGGLDEYGVIDEWGMMSGD